MISPHAAKQLFDDLLEQSRWIYQEMVDGRALGVERHEEPLTESFLLNLRRTNPNVVVRTFERREESRLTGADWAWWWEGEQRWFGALVQAKRLDRRSGRYDFGYRPRRSRDNPSPIRQIDLLMQAARLVDLPPLYVLYNGPDLVTDSGRWTCDEIPFDPPAMGASILPAAAAAWLLSLDATDQLSVNELARPLPCHVCPQRCRSFAVVHWLLQADTNLLEEALGFPAGTTRDDLAFRAAASYLAGLASARTRQFLSLTTGPEVAVVRQGVRESPPLYVRAVLEPDEPFADDLVPLRVVVMRRGNDR